MRALLPIVLLITTLPLFAQVGGREPVTPEVINVDYPGRDRPDREPGTGADRGGRDNSRGSNGSQNNSVSPSSKFSPTTVQALAGVYGVYATMLGYSYSQAGSNISIESSIPISVFENEVKDKNAPGLGFIGEKSLNEAKGILGAENSPGAKAESDKLDTILRRNEQNRNEKFQEIIAAERNFINGDNNQKDAVQIDNQIDQAFSNLYTRGSANIRNETEFNSTLVYAKAHMTIAKRLLNPSTNFQKKFGKDKAYELARELIEVSIATTEFAQGFRSGAERAVVDTVNGVVTISRFAFNGVKNPRTAFNQILDVWEQINFQGVIEGISYAIDSSYDTMMYGTPYMQGEFFGLLSVNIFSTILPMQLSPVLNRLSSSLGTNSIVTSVVQMHQQVAYLGRGAIAKLFNIYGRVTGSKGAASAISAARAAGLTTRSQLENFGLFLNKAMRNQVGAVGSIEQLIQDYSVYFKFWDKNFIVDDVLSADTLNAQWVSRGAQAPFQAGTLVPRVTSTAAPSGLVRVHTNSNKAGRWVCFADEIRGKSPKEIQNYLNLPDVPTHVSTYSGKTGDSFQISRVGQNSYGTNQGGTQLQVIKDVTESDFVNTRPIGPIYDGK